MPLRGSKTNCFRQSIRYSSARHYLKYENNSWNFSLPISLLKRKKFLFLHDHPVCVCVCVYVCPFPFKLWKQLTDFHKTLYEHNAFGGHPTAVFHISYNAQKICGRCSNCEIVVLQLPLTFRSWNYIWKGMFTVVFL